MVIGLQKSIGRIGPRSRNAVGGRLLSFFGRVGSTTGTYTAAHTGWHYIFGWGGGGSGGSSAGTAASGGGSGAAGFIRVWLTEGQTITYTVGGEGVATTVTLPDGRVLTAGGGSAGGAGYVDAGSGGTANGWSINRNGYRGGGYTNTDGNANTNDGGAYTIEAPIGGSYLAFNTAPLGAAAPGFDDVRQNYNLPDLEFTGDGKLSWVSWNINGGGTGQGPGAGGYGKNSSASGYAGRPGQLIIFVLR